MENYHCVVVGAGIIGLAIARKLAISGIKVLVLEANKDIGLETSFRNSAVIHAGVYYPTNSLKSAFCLSGRKMLYQYCKEKGVPHKKIGKLILATHHDQVPVLEKLKNQALSNGVSDISFLSAEKIKNLEPNVSSIGALFSPSTGIVNGRELLLSYKKDIENFQGKVVCSMPFKKAEILNNKFRIYVGVSLEPIESHYLINSAGLSAQEVSKNIIGLPTDSIPKIYYAKGNYFKLIGKKPFCRLIYPVPEASGLGIHATIDMAGVVRFGPDVEWIDNLNYEVNVNRKQLFLESIRQYFPSIQQENLQPEFSGIRPKSQPKENQPQDFEIQTEKMHGIANLVNLYGMESPGLTCSLSIAERVYSSLFDISPTNS